MEVLDSQVAQLLDGARPNRESAARIIAALSLTSSAPDRSAIARLDGRLRHLGLELVEPHPRRPQSAILEEIAALQAQRAKASTTPSEAAAVPVDEALSYLNDLGKLWRETDDTGRRQLALALFVRLGTVADPRPAMHDRRHPAHARIVEIEVTDYAERRGSRLHSRSV